MALNETTDCSAKTVGTRDLGPGTRDKSVFPLITSLYAREGAQGGNLRTYRISEQKITDDLNVSLT